MVQTHKMHHIQLHIKAGYIPFACLRRLSYESILISRQHNLDQTEFKAFSLIFCHVCEHINMAAETLVRNTAEVQLPRVERE